MNEMIAAVEQVYMQALFVLVAPVAPEVADPLIGSRTPLEHVEDVEDLVEDMEEMSAALIAGVEAVEAMRANEQLLGKDESVRDPVIVVTHD